MAQHPKHSREVVHLYADGEEEEGEFAFGARYNAAAQSQEYEDVNDLLQELNQRYSPEFGAADIFVDLTNISDRDSPPPALAARRVEFARISVPEPNHITEAVCLQMILDVLPDICIEHALGLIKANTQENTRTPAQCENIISQLLDEDSYPKEADQAKDKKRKRVDEEEWSRYEKGEVAKYPPTYASEVLDLLRDEFLELSIRTIIDVVREKVTLFKAYIELEQKLRNYGPRSNFKKMQKPRIGRGMEFVLIERGSQTPKELHAVKKKLDIEKAKRQKVEELRRAEDDNLKQAQENGQTTECACCFGETALNRMFSCTGDEAHMYCEDCPKAQVETLIGQSKFTIKCFGVTDCTGTFTRKQLQVLLPQRTFELLEHMQQQAEIAAAGLDFLSECPFCDFKMECLPVEVDKEFRCQNSKCGKTSCRLCQKETHVPLNCEEAKKDSQITLRHIVEEAMTSALIRKCNRCERPFIKETGCNKMNCTNCGNCQCYVCSKDVKDYQHFGESALGRCPLHENVEERHEQEIKTAADEAMAKVRAENPELSQEDLMVQVSDRIKAVEDRRKGHAHAQAQQFPFVMVDNELRRRPGAQPPHVANLVAGRGRVLPVQLQPQIQAPPPPQPAGLFRAALNRLPLIRPWGIRHPPHAEIVNHRPAVANIGRHDHQPAVANVENPIHPNIYFQPPPLPPQLARRRAAPNPAMLAGRRAQLPDAENIDDLVRLNLIRQQARVIEQQHQREHAADVEIRPRVRRSAQLRPLGSVAEPEQNRDVDFAAVTRRRERLPRGIRPGGLDVMLAQRAAQRNGDA